MQQLTPQQAYDFCRPIPRRSLSMYASEMEYMFVGHPANSILIPWVDGPNWDIDPNFVSHVKKAASVNRPVVLICRSGRRSAEAPRR